MISLKTESRGDASHRFAGKTILIVDDDRNLREALSKWLCEALPGVAITEAESGKDALKLVCRREGQNKQEKQKDEGAEKNRVDVVLMDVRLPGLSGIEATRLIKKDAPDVRVIILSQYNGTEFRKKAEEAGAAAYILKRQSARELLPVLRQALELGLR